MKDLLFKKAVGATSDRLEKSASAQRDVLPDSGFAPNNQELLAMLREFLWHAEMDRIAGTKFLPLYPMVMVDGVCTGEPLLLMRVCNRKKMKDGEEIDNPNFGRFFFANKVVRVENGAVVNNEKGYPIIDLDQFCWIDDSPFVKHGALRAIAEPLEKLLLHTHGLALKDEDFWPANIVEFMRSVPVDE